MIYFVDEDFRKLRVLVSELRINGFDATILRDADSAYHQLVSEKKANVDLVIIDVMLAVNPDISKSRYTRANTDDYHKTGLLLLEDLIQSNPEIFPSRAVYLTHASNDILVQEINSSAKKFGVPFLRKKDYETAYAFGKDIVEIIKKIND